MWTRRSILWGTFFAICFGLGYPTLNRYDPTRVGGTSDSLQYFHMAAGQPTDAGHWRYRILVPYVARPLVRVFEGHTRTWNPVALSMLLVNSAFCASSALLLVVVADALQRNLATGVIAAFCYLLNFNVANAQLAGMVDSSEFFMMTCLLWVLLRRRWNALPWLGLLGGIAKETFVPLGVLFATGWTWREKAKLQVAAMALIGVGTTVAVRSSMEGYLVTPFGIAESVWSAQGPMTMIQTALTSWLTWITFAWMTPFLIRGAGVLPTRAAYATALAIAGVFALAAWSGAGVNVVRPLFDVAGPCACLAFAEGVSREGGRDKTALAR